MATGRCDASSPGTGSRWKKERASCRAEPAGRSEPSRGPVRRAARPRSGDPRLHRRDPGLRRGKFWASTNMARTPGRAPRGERLRAAVPHGHWETSTFVAGLRQDGIVAPFVLDGPINRHSFETYVARVLVPDLRPARRCGTCRPTRPTSTLSRTLSASSRRSYVGQPSGPSAPYGTGSASFPTPSRPPTAPITSPPQDTMQAVRTPL